MVLPTLLAVTAALGGPTPGQGRGQDVDERAVQLVVEVNDLSARREYAAAAKLAAEAAADEKIEASLRVQLGGLARENYELSYGAGRKVADLCGQAAVMRLVAPLAEDGGALQRAAAEKVEVQLEQAQGAGWRAACGWVDAPDPTATASLSPTTAEPLPPAPTTRPGERAVESAALAPAPRIVRSQADRRLLRAGVGTLVPGLLLFVPMGAVLAHRAQVEGSLRQLHADTAGRERTAGELADATMLNQRYRGATAAAAGLGATGAALTVTGLVLLATRRGHSRVAVAPWGTRGVGGLILSGRF